MKIKITIESKNCRLKITITSKNYRLKIPVRVRACVRMYARAYDCRTTQERRTHTNGTHDHRKREDSGKTEKPVYICMFAGNEKKYKKSLKKFGNVKKPPYLCIRNQTTNKVNYKISKQ